MASALKDEAQAQRDRNKLLAEGDAELKARRMDSASDNAADVMAGARAAGTW